jgi:hypothetical protein
LPWLLRLPAGYIICKSRRKMLYGTSGGICRSLPWPIQLSTKNPTRVMSQRNNSPAATPAILGDDDDAFLRSHILSRKSGVNTSIADSRAFCPAKVEAQEFGLYVEKANSAAIALISATATQSNRSCTGRKNSWRHVLHVVSIENTAVTRSLLMTLLKSPR